MNRTLHASDPLHDLFTRYRLMSDLHKAQLDRYLDTDGDVEEGQGRAYTRRDRSQAVEARAFLDEAMELLSAHYALPDGVEVTVPGSNGTRYTVVTGQLDGAAYNAFLQGQCHALARAVCDATGWQAAVLLDDDCCYDAAVCSTLDLAGDVCGCRLEHVVAVRPDGAHVDITGAYLPGTVPDYEGCGTIPLTPQVWDFITRSPVWRRPALDVARTFVQPLLAATERQMELAA
ncbi:hypothetical protein QMK19_39070 [Streptomyces sp. H10-C2]|uniref:hypothetical protein n=1 Tax=unclassified Streptomyces TaxID=2593676 RepID=UPI0024B8B674|nr:MULTISPECIES: hypothetical protein [unclassified Streptomyces]MDJ0347214.1 hypothetical protein [Streptomyces sp. PH10-H1]MDJ0375438.1 hypothetical protein [Streptomyces sp. H10-C2]